MVALGNINEWQPPHGPVTMWMAAPASLEAARAARRSDTPPSYQQNQHLWACYHGKNLNRQLPRLMIVAWDIPGTCDIGAMTATINAHVRRQDTYHHWFEFDNYTFVRREIEDPSALEFVPVALGPMTPDQVREHVLTTTPDTLDWGCFTYGIVQHADYFTFYASVDHLHIDGLSAALIFLDIHLMYQEAANSGQEPGALPEVRSYRDYAVRQRERAATLTLSSPEIKDWIAFARDTDGDWPCFPLPLGDVWASTKGDLLTVELMDPADTEAFETACVAAGARFIGGVLACTALAERELTGKDSYHGFTAKDTRIPGIDSMTLGWFASLIPVTVPTAGETFAEAARAAQKSFDDAQRLADVPVERILELATPDQLGIKLPTQLPMMLSFLDFRRIPLNGLWAETRFGTYGDSLSHGGVNMWINRQVTNTTVTMSFPDNAIARESVHRYIAALILAFTRVARPTSDEPIVIAAQVNSEESYAAPPDTDDHEAA